MGSRAIGDRVLSIQMNTHLSTKTNENSLIVS